MTSKLRMIWRLARHKPLSWLAARPMYSQYGEDVLFKRLLHPTRCGTYVDVGAYHPVYLSNTFALYQMGWNGLTIEPNPANANLFRRLRPHDVHVVSGAAEHPAELTYHEYADAKRNTFSQETADWLKSQNEPSLRTQMIACRPLREIIADTIPGRQIDLLSVDCEGDDLSVLRSLGPDIRPTVLMLEDVKQFADLRDGQHDVDFNAQLRTMGYYPIAHAAWSFLYVASDWRDLIRRSPAYRPGDLDAGMLPSPSNG